MKELFGPSAAAPFVAALAIAIATPCAAQDTDAFTGFYGGVSASYDLLDDDGNGTVTFDKGSNGTFGDTITTSTGANAFAPGFCGGAPTSASPSTACETDDDELSFAARLGYDWALGDNLVGGFVAEVSSSNLSDSLTAFSSTPATYTFTRKVDFTAALRTRVGFATGTGLFYMTGGMVGAKMDNRFATTNTANSFTPEEDDCAWGYQLGGGAEFALSERMSLGLEYLYNDIGHDNYSVAVGRGTAGATNPFVLAGGATMKPEQSGFAWHAVRAVANFRF